jgi:hypothetical protein
VVPVTAIGHPHGTIAVVLVSSGHTIPGPESQGGGGQMIAGLAEAPVAAIAASAAAPVIARMEAKALTF